MSRGFGEIQRRALAALENHEVKHAGTRDRYRPHGMKVAEIAAQIHGEVSASNRSSTSRALWKLYRAKRIGRIYESWTINRQRALEHRLKQISEGMPLIGQCGLVGDAKFAQRMLESLTAERAAIESELSVAKAPTDAVTTLPNLSDVGKWPNLSVANSSTDPIATLNSGASR
jgi:hypothetical protein